MCGCVTIKLYLQKQGNSLTVQWLGLSAFTAVARLQSLVEELRSSKPCGVAKQTNKQKKTQTQTKTNNKE